MSPLAGLSFSLTAAAPGLALYAVLFLTCADKRDLAARTRAAGSSLLGRLLLVAVTAQLFVIDVLSLIDWGSADLFPLTYSLTLLFVVLSVGLYILPVLLFGAILRPAERIAFENRLIVIAAIVTGAALTYLSVGNWALARRAVSVGSQMSIFSQLPPFNIRCGDNPLCIGSVIESALQVAICVVAAGFTFLILRLKRAFVGLVVVSIVLGGLFHASIRLLSGRYF